jgi:hypothetical protein
MAQTNANLIWKIADELRGPYQPNKYGDVILSFTVLRRPTPGPPTPSKHPSVAGRTACTGGRRASNRLTTTARSRASASNWTGRPPRLASPQTTRRTNRTRNTRRATVGTSTVRPIGSSALRGEPMRMRININRQTLRVDQGVEVTDTERLPEPLITNYEWQADAACRGMGLATFFTRPKNETPSDGIRQDASPSI